MAQIRLIPSTYYLSNSSYLSVSSASNMYANTDSTTYATVTNSRTSTTSYYIYIRGFNFDDVPSNAIVSSITIKLKAYHSGGNTSTIYCYNGTTQVAAAGSTTALTTSATVKTLTSTTIDWDTLKGYGSNFGIRINCRRSSRNTTAYVYIYGAEILVDYTIPVYHNVTVIGDSTKVIPTGTESVLEGSGYEVKMYYDTKPTVTDNGIDVTSSVTASSSDTTTLIPNNYTNSGFTISNIDNAYADADSDTYAQLTAPAGGATSTIYLDFEDLSLPSGATIQSVTAQATLQFSRNNSSSGVTASCQMYAGSTAKGSSTTIVSSATDVAKTTYNLSIGTWTASELNNARFFITVTNNASSTQRLVYIYGVSLNVTYEFDGVIYIYTIGSVNMDHAIVVTAAVAAQDELYIKVNGSWVDTATIVAVYKKVNGSWVQQSDLTNVFDSGTNYKVG